MKKRYLLDTNVLLHDPTALTAFQDNSVLVPIYVIEEIDRFKKQLTRLGENARWISRFLDGLRDRGRLSDGVVLDTGGRLRVVFDPDDPQQVIARSDGWVDNEILKIARRIQDDAPDTPLILVTKDVNLRIKADAMGLVAEDYETDRVNLDELYSGHTEIELDSGELERFRAEGELALPEGDFFPNEYALLKDRADAANTALARIDPMGGWLKALIDVAEGVQGIRPRNKEQYFALDALLDPTIVLVTIMGKAGTGKTLLALAAGLEQVLRRTTYRHLLISRPTFPMGKDIGYLPGSVEEKLNPWMQPIYDNLALLLDGRPPRNGTRTVDDLVSEGRSRRRAADAHPRAVDPAAVHARRRGPEPDAPRGQDDPHARGREHEARPHRRPVADRHALHRFLHERLQSRGQPLPHRAPGRARRAPEGRAV